MTAPGFTSLALRDIPAPDYADVILLPIPAGAPTDPGLWAETIFGPAAAPLWVRAALGLRQALVPLLGLKPSPSTIFAVREREGEEALIAAEEKHLSFRAAVGVDTLTRTVRVTTTVALHGRRGRLYFGPVRLAHPVVVHSMMRGAIRTLTPA